MIDLVIFLVMAAAIVALTIQVWNREREITQLRKEKQIMLDIRWKDNVLTRCAACDAELIGCYQLIVDRYGNLVQPPTTDLCIECIEQLAEACDAVLESR